MILYRYYIVYFFTIITVFVSCSDNFTNTEPTSGRVVVDASIEVGASPKVVLTYSLPLTAKIDSSAYYDVVNTRAKVTISDGEKTEILTLVKRKNSFPPHYYTSQSIKGIQGKTYSLEVVYYSDTLRSQTTIPQSVAISDIWTEPHATDSTQRYVWISFCDDVQTQNYYRIFTQIRGKQNDFVPTYQSAFRDDYFNGTCPDVMLYKGIENFYDKNREDTYSVGDTVLIKISAIDKQSYLFWNNYEKEVFNSGNPFASNGFNLTSNIENGMGIWCGYASKVYFIIIK
ncbi:MAG TPA: hypothetical protein PK734_00235 [Bacteroidales bacterium]|nr:hypothetical protein [Bacteroidales bacterium]